MPGKVARVLAKAGAKVQAGEGVLVIEAMKMQNEVRAPREGTIASIQVKEGQAVNAGEVVAIID
jgi:biotin carboxyl carrier protein